MSDQELKATPAAGSEASIATTTLSSPYRRRFDDRASRREAWESLLKSTKTQPKQGTGDKVSIKPRLNGHEEDRSATTNTISLSLDDDEIDGPPECERKYPLHLEEQSYYRVVYRGVVALVEKPDSKSRKTGAYVSYGEIIASQYQEDVEEMETVATLVSPPAIRKMDGSLFTPDSPPRSVMSNHTGSVSSLDTSRTFSSAGAPKLTYPARQPVSKQAIRVDRVLTGGYAMDATEVSAELQVGTPKRSNLLPMVGPSPLPFPDSPSDSATENMPELGYIFSAKNHTKLVELVREPPVIETGKFIYQITSSTPVQMFTGPCMDAPLTKAVLLPGSKHEVCLRLMSDENIMYLRLSHRRGWVPNRKVSVNNGIVKIGPIPSVKEITNENMSMTSSTTPAAMLRRRHRPPRRKRVQELNRSRTDDIFSTPKKEPRQQEASPQLDMTMTPSSNISLLSEDDYLSSTSTNKSRMMMTPDRSAARFVNRSVIIDPEEPKRSYFFMRVNAPRGLKMLDAPQFQVSSLIHGSQPQYRSTGESIFAVMPRTTKPTQQNRQHVGNPAIFDSVKKQRILPRGAVFEASRRMEQSSSFNQGMGLIKLSDNSGWAIVPSQDELELQYRHFHAGVADIKEGEATRAYEEVGNCIITTDDESDYIWVRVTSRRGVTVKCPPPFVPVDESSPTSSVGGSSGGGSNYGPLTSHESDVASSVGSAFLDAMFRTPSKKSRDDRVATPHPFYMTDPSTTNNSITVVCGTYLQINKWDDTTTNIFPAVSHEFVRLRSGQGWIPRSIVGKPVIERISAPEIQLGSFWFRVLSPRGIKVRLGPSRKATSIKSENNIYFRFECGEFLRASEIVTFFTDDSPPECFAKLYRNRHVRLQSLHSKVQSLQSLAAPAEWVQVSGDEDMYLEQCESEPHIQRHRGGWRYNAVSEAGVTVRKGPSFAAEHTGIKLLAGESVLVTERVTPPGERMIWLRLKDGKGWVHDIDAVGTVVMIAHSLRERTPARRPHKQERSESEEVAYNTIIARLFPGADEENQDQSG